MSSTPIPAQPEKILRALGQVWTSLGEEERHQGRPTVLRACAMTLIVITDEEDEDSSPAAQTLTELMHVHPSRAIVLRVDKNEENGLSARVFAQCWKPFGKAQQICCEQIEVSALPERWPDIGPTVLGIIVPDLPVVIWSRQKAVLRKSGGNDNPGLNSVLELATKVIVDTKGADLAEAFSVLQQWRANDRLFGDLEWTRLTAWRETLSTAFDDPGAPLSSFTKCDIFYAGDSIPASVYYLAAWLKRGLNVEFTFGKEDGFDAGPTRVVLQAPNATIELKRTGPVCLQLTSRDQVQRVSLAGSTSYELMNEELTVLGRDPIFNDVFDRVKEIHS